MEGNYFFIIFELFINSNNELKGANVAVMGLYDKGKTHILN